MSENEGRKPATWLAQALGWIEPRYGEIVPPLHLSTTYERDADLSYPKGRVYGRDQNPTYDQAEALLARLECGEGAMLFASGMAAASACFLALRPGDHVVAPKVMYWALRKWLIEEARIWGLRVDFFRNDSIEDLTRCVRAGETRLVWVETPANPTWLVTDIRRAADIAHAAGARLAVDSTVATPILTRPIEHGADLVMHAATKYLNGHSDVLAGALIAAHADEYWQRLHAVRAMQGGILGPFEAWLLLRGMRTLHLRVAAACRNAERIAVVLQDHRNVVGVLYPGLGNDPGHAVAARQMQGGFGGMLSVRVAGGQEGARRFAAALRLFKRATSLGGVESLVEHRASIEGPDSPAPVDMLRLSVGAEDAEDLIADLLQALESI